MRKILAALFLALTSSIATAQAPPPVPALPDTERRTSYSITATTCNCAVGFALYGDSTDYANWLEVFINGSLMPQAGNWTISSPTGPLSTIPRPITDAVLNFTVAQTGTVQIIGARRPRRTSQFSESRGVAARDLNLVLTDIIAQNREQWDTINDFTGRVVRAPPGETLALLPKLSSRANTGACFDGSGNLTSCVSIPASTFAAGNGILFTGVTPTVISNNISAGSGITFTGTNPIVISSPPGGITYTPTWTGGVAYLQSKYNANVVNMTDFMGTTTCDGTNFIGGTGGASSTTLTVASVTSGVLAAGQTIGGTGITVGTTITAQLTGPAGGAGTYTMSGARTIATGTVIQGGTNQLTNMQAFLTQLSANGVAGNSSVTGQFAPGNCFVSGASPTFTMQTSNYANRYYLLGYGTTITPDPSGLIDGLFIHRGSLTNHQDEQSGVTVEGLTINARNNANIQWGIEFDNWRTYLIRNNVMAGDDGTTHAQVNFAGIYGHQQVATDPNTGPFWSQVIGNNIKGNATGSSFLPLCMRFDGQVNALAIIENACAQAITGIRVANACATVNANCAAQANGVVVANNSFELLSTGIFFATTVPSLTAIAGWHIYGNRVESMSLSFVDISQIQVQSLFPMQLGPNMLIGSFTYLSNAATKIAVEMFDKAMVLTSLSIGLIAANSTQSIGAVAAPGATTSMPCKAGAVNDLSGIQLTCFVSSTGNITFRVSNPTSAGVTPGAVTIFGEAQQNY